VVSASVTLDSDPSRREAMASSARPAIDVVVRWGDWVLSATELSPPRAFSVGEEGADIVLPAAIVGAKRAVILLARWDGEARLVVSETARVKLDGQGKRLTAVKAIAKGKARASTTVKDAAEVELLPGQTISLFFGPITIDVTRSQAAPRAARNSVIERRLGFSHLFSLTLHALLGLAVFTFGSRFVDPYEQFEGISEEQKLALQSALNRIAEREYDDDTYAQYRDAVQRRARRNERRLASMFAALREDEWARARYSEGWSGTSIAQAQAQDLANAGEAGPELFGGFYDKSTPPAPKPPTPPPARYGSPDGSAPQETIGFVPSYGYRTSRPPQLRMGEVLVSGRLPKEVIQRIVRQNFGRFRLCYENGLRNNPNLQGRVAVRFVIGRDGAISNVGNGGSDMPDGGVVSCVVRAFAGLNFPQPEGGIVVVVYPIMFAPPG